MDIINTNNNSFADADKPNAGNAVGPLSFPPENAGSKPLSDREINAAAEAATSPINPEQQEAIDNLQTNPPPEVSNLVNDVNAAGSKAVAETNAQIQTYQQQPSSQDKTDEQTKQSPAPEEEKPAREQDWKEKLLGIGQNIDNITNTVNPDTFLNAPVASINKEAGGKVLDGMQGGADSLPEGAQQIAETNKLLADVANNLIPPAVPTPLTNPIDKQVAIMQASTDDMVVKMDNVIALSNDASNTEVAAKVGELDKTAWPFAQKAGELAPVIALQICQPVLLTLFEYSIKLFLFLLKLFWELVLSALIKVILLEVIFPALAFLKAQLLNLLQTLSTLIPDLSPVFQAMMMMMEALLAKMAELVATINQYLQDTALYALELAEELTNILNQYFSEAMAMLDMYLLNPIQDFVAGPKSFFAQLFKALGILTDKINVFLGKWKDSLNALASAQAWQAIIEEIKTRLSLTGLLPQMPNLGLTPLEEYFAKTTQQFQGMLDAITTRLPDLKAKLEAFGSQFLTSLPGIMKAAGGIAASIACLKSKLPKLTPGNATGKKSLVVVSGATIQCTGATAPPMPLTVLPLGHKTKQQQELATMVNVIPFLNIKPFGNTCQLATNPMSAAQLGVPPYPCTPLIMPFTPAAGNLSTFKIPVAVQDSLGMCLYAAGGMIRIANPGQQIVQAEVGANAPSDGSSMSGKAAAFADRIKAKALEKADNVMTNAKGRLAAQLAKLPENKLKTALNSALDKMDSARTAMMEKLKAAVVMPDVKKAIFLAIASGIGERISREFQAKSNHYKARAANSKAARAAANAQAVAVAKQEQFNAAKQAATEKVEQVNATVDSAKAKVEDVKAKGAAIKSTVEEFAQSDNQVGYIKDKVTGHFSAAGQVNDMASNPAALAQAAGGTFSAKAKDTAAEKLAGTKYEKYGDFIKSADSPSAAADAAKAAAQEKAGAAKQAATDKAKAKIAEKKANTTISKKGNIQDDKYLGDDLL